MYGTRPQYRHRFSKEEDEQLLELASVYANNNSIIWENVASHMKNRSPRQCRERFNNYLTKKTRKGNWTNEEDELIIYMFNIYGPKWVLIASYFDGRSNIDIKNRYAKLMRNKKDILIKNEENYKNSSAPNNYIQVSSSNFYETIFLVNNENQYVIPNVKIKPVLVRPIVYRYLI